MSMTFTSGAFAKLRKATVIRFIIPVCLSVRRPARNIFSSHWTDFNEIRYLNIFRKSVDNIQVLLKFYKNNGHFT